MDEKIKNVVLALAGRISSATTPDEALKLTQAALNIANAGRALVEVEVYTSQAAKT